MRGGCYTFYSDWEEIEFAEKSTTRGRGCMTENEPYEELEEIKKIKELSKKYKGKRCSQYCSVWNSWDKDCEIMGSYHLSPSRCRWFLMQELRREDNACRGEK